MISVVWGFWPFVHSGLLWWGLAGIIPIAIHFLSRRRYRETTWAAMQFLLAAWRNNARRLRMEQLILLVLRVAVLVLLAIALAEPLFSTRSPAGAQVRGGHTHWLLVIDASFSMDYRERDKSLFDHARDAAKELLSTAEQGDGFTLVLLADPPQPIIREPAFDTTDVIREIDGLTMRHGGADLVETLTEAKNIAEQAQKRYPRLTTTRICFFTDLGKNSWEAVESAAGRKLLADLEKTVRLHVLQMGQSDWQNAAVTRLDMLDPIATVDRDVRFLAEVRRFSPDVPRQVQVETRIDDQLLRTEPLDLTTGAATLSFVHRFASPGDHAVEVRLRDADPLDIDNHRWRTAVVRETIRALCVEGHPRAARYVAIALEPRHTERPLVIWETAPESALLERDLSLYDCIFLCNIGRFTQEEADALQNYVHGGGGLAIFLGDQVQSDDYNQKLGVGLGNDALLPARLGQVVSTALTHFDPLEYKHPLVRPFAEHERAGLLTVPTWRYVKLSLDGESPSQIVLAFDNGDPALVERRVGRGQVFLFASSATPAGAARDGERQDWTEFPTWPSFPPVIQELVGLAIKQADTTRSVLVGEPLESAPLPQTIGTAVLITNPLGDAERLLIPSKQQKVGQSDWHYPATFWSGLYRVQYEGEEGATQLFAVNVDHAESDLVRYDASQLPSQFVSGFPEPGTDPLNSVRSATSFSRHALALLLGLVLLETFLACHFGMSRQ